MAISEQMRERRDAALADLAEIKARMQTSKVAVRRQVNKRLGMAKRLLERAVTEGEWLVALETAAVLKRAYGIEPTAPSPIDRSGANPAKTTVMNEPMDFDTEHEILHVATELFELAGQEMESEAKHRAAVLQAASEVLWRHPGFPKDLLQFAMGRALGRREGALRERMKGSQQ
jgi:hypothetical protein